MICPKFKPTNQVRNVTEVIWMDFSQAVFLEFKCPSHNIGTAFPEIIVLFLSEIKKDQDGIAIACSFHGLCVIKHLSLNAY